MKNEQMSSVAIAAAIDHKNSSLNGRNWKIERKIWGKLFGLEWEGGIWADTEKVFGGLKLTA